MSDIFSLVAKAVPGVSVFLKLAVPVSRNIAERVDDLKTRRRIMRIVGIVQENSLTVLDALASLQQSKLKSAHLCIKLGLTQLEQCCDKWRVAHEDQAQRWDGLESCKYFHHAMDNFRTAEKYAMVVLHDENSRTPLRIDALAVLLYCQTLLHWNDYKVWLKTWQVVLESFFEDEMLTEIAVGKQSEFSKFITPEIKQAATRMKGLVAALKLVIASMLVKDPTIAEEVGEFVEFFNNSTANIEKLADDWKQLMEDCFYYPTAGYLNHIVWVPDDGAHERGVICVWHPSGGKFVMLSPIADMTWVESDMVYGVSCSNESLIRVDLTEPMTHIIVDEREWRIFGYTEEGLLYGTCGSGTISSVDVLSDTPAITENAKILPLEASSLSDYVFLVAINGTILAYNKETGRRYVSFKSHELEWIEGVGEDKDRRTRVSRHDKLLVVGPDDAYCIMRVGLVRIVDGDYYGIRVEKVRLVENGEVSTEPLYFPIDPFSDGMLVTDTARLSDKASVSVVLFIAAKNGEDIVQVRKYIVAVEMGCVTNIEQDYDWSMEFDWDWDGELSDDKNKLTFGDDIIFM